MSVAVCDLPLWHGLVRLVDVLGKHVRTIPLATGGKHGIAVTKDELYMAISYSESNALRVYRFDAGGEVRLLHTLARSWRGHSGPLEFSFPYRLCLTPCGNLLVCDSGNNRVQELTAPSELPPAFVRTFPAPGACSVALHGDTLAIGTDFGCITLLDYTTGRAIRTIGTRGAGLGEIGHSCEGLCFTPDGKSLLAAEYRNNRLSMFCVRDGSWQQHIGAGMVSHGNNDVALTAAGEILVADFGNNRVCVFSADGSTLLRSWGTPGSGDGQFAFPTALALVGAKLYVLDGDGTRVQVFE